MTQKLFYKDAYCQTGNTIVVSHGQDALQRSYLTLEETIFYPTGGGQPHDLGTIKGIQVNDVEEVEGELRHYVAESSFEVGEAVDIQIDWKRRFDFMQQHTGQHLLTASFVELYKIETTSFHLGKELVSIDLDVKSISDHQLIEVEKRANQLILENHPIVTKWVTKEELMAYPLRKQVAVEEDIRLVIVPDIDYNGCGGTHPSSTGEIGALKILNTEMQKGKVRVHFVCGGRVLEQLHHKQKIMQEITQLLSAPETRVAPAVKALLDNGNKMEKLLNEMKDQLLTFEVKDLLGELREDFVSIERVYQQRSIQDLQKLARLTVAVAPKGQVVFIAENEGLLQFVLARGTENLTNMKELTAQILTLINGKGGGSESFAQGGGSTDLTGQQLLEKMKC